MSRRPPLGFSPSVSARLSEKAEVCQCYLTILFAAIRTLRSATLLNSAFGPANPVGRSDESYCIGPHRCKKGLAALKCWGTWGVPVERAGWGTPRLPPLDFSPVK